MRCAACGNTWRVEKELVLDNGGGPAPATFVDEPQLTREQIERTRRAASAGASPTAAFRAKQAQRQRLEKFRAAAIAWGGAGASLALLLVGAVVFRQGVASVWPNTASAYAAIGLGVNITGLEFSDLQIVKSTDAENPSLTVSGAVRNIGSKPKDAPVLRFGLRDQHSSEVKTWLVSLSGGPIEPGDARPFQSVLVNPPVAAVDLEAAFATAAEAKKAPPAQVDHLISAPGPAAEAAPAAKPKPAAAVAAADEEAHPAPQRGLTIIEPKPAAGDHAEPPRPTSNGH